MGAEQITVLDLFAGAGGLTAGFHESSSRFVTVGAVEMDQAAAGSYEATFGAGKVFAGSMQDWLRSDLVPSTADVIVGGPPCQGFSTLGKQDVEDERNALWETYAETIQRVRPKYFVVENVAAFTKSPQFAAFKELVGTGELRDYAFDHAILNSADYGAPQARKRAVLVGHHRDLPSPGLPAKTHSADPERTGLRPYLNVSNALVGVPLTPDMDSLFETRRTDFNSKSYAGQFVPRELHWSRNYSDLSLRRFAAIPAGGNRFNLTGNLLAPCWVNHTSGSGDVMGRLHWDRPSVTIRTEFFKPEKGRYLHPSAMRAITHYEAALLQGFPPSHKFVGSKTAIARQIGNAVPIPLGRAIADHLLAQL
jgi:DNA (cytosine-5)-methyltransferase 1